MILRLKPIALLALLLAFATCKKNESTDEQAKVSSRKITNDAEVSFQLKGAVAAVEVRSFATDANGNAVKPLSETYDQYDFDAQFNANGQLTAIKKYLSEGRLHEQAQYEGMDYPIEIVQFLDETRQLRTVYQWNDDKAIEISKYNPDGSLFSKVRNSYKDNLLQEFSSHGSDSSKVNRKLLSYDEQGHVVKEVFMLNQTATNSIVRSFAADGTLSEEFYLDTAGNTTARIAYQYQNNNKTAVTHYGPNNEITFEERFVYDTNGKIIEHQSRDQIFKSLNTEFFAYDEQGRLLTSETRMNDKVLQKVKQEYDTHGNLSLIQTTDFNGYTKTKSYEYTYDSNGNWIQKRIQLEGTPVFLVKRNIRYFNDSDKATAK